MSELTTFVFQAVKACLLVLCVVDVIRDDAELSKFSETAPISFLVKAVTEEECPRKLHITPETMTEPKRGRGKRNMNVCTLYGYLGRVKKGNFSIFTSGGLA